MTNADTTPESGEATTQPENEPTLESVLEAVAKLSTTVSDLHRGQSDLNDGFGKYRKQTNKDLERLRRRDGVESDVETTGSNAAADLAAAVKMQRAINGLPDSLVGEIVDRISSGESTALVLREVEAIKRGMSLNGTAENASGHGDRGANGIKPPRDKAKTGPREPSIVRPVSKKAFGDLMRKDRSAAMMLLRDDTFALEMLPD
ncbi:MAG: hypothetical protein CBC38_00785 [Gammaproteobacteria bacterium TMED78]|nr:MAG: hypothetical protein CBC38_00785 [Gammaproteobacteria bacterium TMED78]